MHKVLWSVRGQQLPAKTKVAKISFDECDAFVLEKRRHVAAFEARIVIIVEIIENDNGVLGFQQQTFN